MMPLRSLAVLAAALVFSTTTVRASTLYSGQFFSIATYDTNATTPAPTTFATAAVDEPQGIAFDSSGNLFVANNLNGTIEKYTPAGAGSLFASLSQPEGLAFDTSGNLYVASASPHSEIEKFTPGGVESNVISSGVNVPTGLAFDGMGNLFVANLGSNTIEKFTPGGVGSVFASSGLNQPDGLAFDSAGNLYVANLGNNTIEKFTPGGVGSVFAYVNSPTFLALDPAGNVYVSSLDGGIEKFTPDGVGTLFASTPNTGTFGLAFGPEEVPEPATLWFACLGLVSLGLHARRSDRRRRAAA